MLFANIVHMNMFLPSTKSSQSGYVAVITLLIMVVLLSLGLSLANQATQEISLAGNESEQVRVFNSAEAALDTLLADPTSYLSDEDLPSELNDINNSDLAYSVTAGNLETYLQEGSTATIDLSNSSPSSISLIWKDNLNCANSASLLIAIYSDDGADSYSSRYLGAKPYICGGAEGPPGFSAPIGAGGEYQNLYTISGLTTDDKLIRVKVLLANTTLKITGAGNQQYTAQAEATGNTDGVTSVIQGTKTLPAAPAIFDYALYSGSNIIKN